MTNFFNTVNTANKAADAAQYKTEGGATTPVRYVIEYDGLRMSDPDYDSLLNRFKEKFPGRQLWKGTLQIL
jgi:hypothetical protein